MRKGFTLTEMLVVFVVLISVSLVFAPVFTTLVSDIPQSYRVSQENTALLDMLKQMRKDIDAATQLPDLCAGHRADDKLLLIESKAGCVCYQLKNGKVLRRRLSHHSPSRQNNFGDTTLWSVPQAGIKWGVWRKNGRSYAVEVKTYIKYNVQGGQQKRMANSHLYFIGAFGEALK